MVIDLPVTARPNQDSAWMSCNSLCSDTATQQHVGAALHQLYTWSDLQTLYGQAPALQGTGFHSHLC